MSPLLQRQRSSLYILRIWQESPAAERPDAVNFELSLRGDMVFSHQSPLSDLGFPDSIDDLFKRPIREPQFSVPPAVRKALYTFISEGSSGETLWLDLESLDTHLAFVPWERLLGEEGGYSMRVIRLPALTLKPESFGETVNIVLCLGDTSAADILYGRHPAAILIEHIFEESLPARTFVHVFTNQRRARALRGVFPLLLRDIEPDAVRIYEPTEALANEVPERVRNVLEREGHLDNPWLNWMANELADVAVNVVHFFCDGSASSEQGELIFAASPLMNEGRAAPRSVNVQELDTFLTRVGAYSVAFTVPRNGYSILGLRLLAAELSRLRIGPVLLHEPHFKLDFDDLCYAYKYLYTNSASELPLLRTLTLYCSPALVDKKLGEGQADGALEMLWRARDGLRELTRGRERLAWAVAGYRFVEKLAAVYSEVRTPEEEDKQERAELKGVADAINLAAELVWQYAREHSRNEVEAKGEEGWGRDYSEES